MKNSDIQISFDGTHHLINGKPLYEHRFNSVLKFHEPDIAPVKDASGAYHINYDGNPIYAQRFIRTFGFYQGLAAVESADGFFHIDIKGRKIYQDKYTWCGNFQEGLCPVSNQKGQYFHITKIGKELSPKKYNYVGDFKDGFAVVCIENGLNTHINKSGKYLHNKWFEQLDIYHKDFARAKDSQGWFHINIKGMAIYRDRFEDLEPFYNGIAHAKKQGGDVVLINEQGKIVKVLPEQKTNLAGEVSGDLVGFWKSEIIKLAVSFKLFDYLPNSLEKISKKTAISYNKLERFLRALEEAGFVNNNGRAWEATEKGKLLSPTKDSHMAAAALMWPQVQKQWWHLQDKLKNAEEFYHPTFKEEEKERSLINTYQKTLDGYSKLDFKDIADFAKWQKHENILAMGRTAVVAMRLLLESQQHLKGTIINANCPVHEFDIPEPLDGRITKLFLTLDEKWPELKFDGLFLPRFLHHFPDKKAIEVLKKLKKNLLPGSTVYIFEMLLSENSPAGGLLDINMLAESGGRLRTLSRWKNLLKESGFTFLKFEEKKPHLHMIEGGLID